MRVSCPCLNLRFTAELSRRSAKKPAVGFQPDVNRSSPTRKPIRGSRDEAFFVACEEGVVENIVAVSDADIAPPAPIRCTTGNHRRSRRVAANGVLPPV